MGVQAWAALGSAVNGETWPPIFVGGTRRCIQRMRSSVGHVPGKEEERRAGSGVRAEAAAISSARPLPGIHPDWLPAHCGPHGG